MVRAGMRYTVSIDGDGQCTVYSSCLQYSLWIIPIAFNHVDYDVIIAIS